MKNQISIKNFLQLSLGISALIISISLFIFSVNPTSAQTNNSTYMPIGVQRTASGDYFIVGFNKNAPEGQKMKVLARQAL